MSISEQVKSVQTREEFVEFVKVLSKDFKSNQATWENKDAGSFLEALASWVEDMDGYYLNEGKTVPKQLDWNVAANMLVAAKMYE